MDWLCHLLRNIHHWDCPTLHVDIREIVKEGLLKMHMAEDSGEGNEADEKDLEQHSSHGKGLSDVERYNAALHTT